jgi:hypothetical protein
MRKHEIILLANIIGPSYTVILIAIMSFSVSVAFTVLPTRSIREAKQVDNHGIK